MEPIRLSELSGELPRPGVLCTVAKVIGSAPQAPGAKMHVWAGGFQGTVGGGKFEAEVLAHARLMLASARPEASLREYTLCREMGQCCGGKVTVFFEPLARRKAVHIFGAGHVSRALAAVLDGLDLEVAVYDARAEWADFDAFPKMTRLLHTEPLPLAKAAGYGPLDAALVMTYDHDLDLALVDALLDKPLGYLGVIGSLHKSRVFRARLPINRRVLWDASVRCPIGRKIPSKNPKAIAVSMAAELLEKWAYRVAAPKAAALK
ncbi:MAG: xanthine dehydrogenase accessory protein XdhC [Elusimicrobia bacterium]|nr:xanthine dehydrogenase accessory protein XdhC [Elusimicrobiota bacterium]